MENEGISCPKCDWSPDDTATWICICEYEWNTFETYGRCPECGKIYEHTKCLNCGEFSFFDSWLKE